MTERRGDRLRRAWAALWVYERPAPRARAILLGLVACALLTEVLLYAATSDFALGARSFVGTVASVAIALFAWRPPVAVFLLLVGGVLAVVHGGAVEYLLAMTVALGLVAVTSSSAVTGIYATTIIALVILQIVRGPDGLTIGATAVLSVLGLGSFLLGRSFREQHERSRAMRRTLTEYKDAVAREVRQERVRIADELHDIVAHEITIVVLHARAMEHTDDPDALRVSRAAILHSGVQALADIRRMLDVAPAAHATRTDVVLAAEGFVRALGASTETLADAGIEVEIEFPKDLDASRTVITTLVRVSREACMNVLKHATAATRVSIVVRRNDEGVLLTVQDDSPTAAPADVPASGYGLARMAERVGVLGGTLETLNTDPGWRLTARIPLTH
ncbi:sensor histidine kinase [Cryobacterium sp. Y50]|uniref:sensor histidine kinase n=1 Tax=Cryobacterium sp. Y50 TaxID=2048286 RepID=UPI000CE35E31|nr:histidine kinase [Cryobacterium sp. Y50]